MKSYKGVVSLFFLSLLIFSSFAFAEDQKSPTETYIDELHAQGKERVIVSFKDDATVDTSLVDKYGGKLIRVFTTIKALVCEIPQENIEALRAEESVKRVSPDMILKAQPDEENRDLAELALFLKLKKGYLRKIKEERLNAIRQATEDYLKALKVLIAKRNRIQQLYNETLRKFNKANKKNKPLYQAQLAQYRAMLKDYNLEMRRLLQEYRQKVKATKDAYVTAQSEWEERVNEMMILSYGGTVTIRWNNLEAGLNSKATWDRYALDGTGIKIAILDTGVNYNLVDLGGGIGPGFKCLGGYDFVSEDSDPINPTADEWHGTEVAALAVAKGVLKAVGVAYNASYYALRVAQGPNNPPATALTSDVMAGIEWASTEPHKADIISMSLGIYDEDQQGNPFWPYIKQDYEAVCNNAYNAGVILVAGSGNRGYDHSAYPAAFANVISVGAHTEEQTIATFTNGSSNGGVDIVSPGKWVYSIHPDESGWLMSGTSYATPQASALLALQLQYARRQYTQPADLHKNMQPNNGYLWEVMNHSAKDLGLDEIWQGNGKIWAADTIPPPADPPPPLPWTPKDGSIDAMIEKWPLNYSFEYLNSPFDDPISGYPAYYIGTTMDYDVALTNNTGTAGNYTDDIENLNVKTTQAYYQEHGGINLPGSPIEVFPTISSLIAGDQTTLTDSYYLPWSMYPGIDRIILDFEFELTSNTSILPPEGPIHRLIKVSYPCSSLWCPPPAVNEGFPVE